MVYLPSIHIKRRFTSPCVTPQALALQEREDWLSSRDQGNYLVMKSFSPAGGAGQISYFATATTAMAALRGPSRASTRSIRPLACPGLVALLYTDARNIDEFEDNLDANGNVPPGYAATPPVSFYLTFQRSNGTWINTSETPIYSREVDNLDGEAGISPFTIQYDGDGAHFSAVAVAYPTSNPNQPENTTVPNIHLVTNNGDKTAYYFKFRPGLGLVAPKSFPASYKDGRYKMNAGYMHVAYDPASRDVLASFSANDTLPVRIDNENPVTKAILTFTSINGGGTWNDTTPDVMIPYDDFREAEEPRFEMPAIIGSPHVFLQQVDSNPNSTLISDFTFVSYYLQHP